MKKIIYSGKDRNGKSVSGFVEADSSKAAIALLHERDISDVRLHDDGLTAFQRPDLDGLSERELAAVAEFEIKVREGSGLVAFLAEVVRKNALVILAGIVLFVWGYRADSILWMTAGTLLASSVIILSLWNYRVVDRYNKLLRCEAIGEMDEALSLIGQLKDHMQQPEMAFDLAIREACIMARGGSLNEAVALVERFRESFDEDSPGLFESRVAGIYHACGRYDQAVKCMRSAFAKSSQSPTVIVDLALAEARFGDIAEAEAVLDAIVEEELPQFGRPFVDWVRGVIALRKQDGAAREHLKNAVTALMEFGGNPAIWTPLGVCTGYYAAALSEVDVDGARKLLRSVWPIVKVHGDADLLGLIRAKMPEVANMT